MLLELSSEDLFGDRLGKILEIHTAFFLNGKDWILTIVRFWARLFILDSGLFLLLSVLARTAVRVTPTSSPLLPGSTSASLAAQFLVLFGDRRRNRLRRNGT